MNFLGDVLVFLKRVLMHGELVVVDDRVFGGELLFNECDLRFEGLDFEMGLFGLGKFLLLLVKSLLSF